MNTHAQNNNEKFDPTRVTLFIPSLLVVPKILFHAKFQQEMNSQNLNTVSRVKTFSILRDTVMQESIMLWRTAMINPRCMTHGKTAMISHRGMEQGDSLQRMAVINLRGMVEGIGEMAMIGMAEEEMAMIDMAEEGIFQGTAMRSPGRIVQENMLQRVAMTILKQNRPRVMIQESIRIGTSGLDWNVRGSGVVKSEKTVLIPAPLQHIN